MLLSLSDSCSSSRCEWKQTFSVFPVALLLCLSVLPVRFPLWYTYNPVSSLRWYSKSCIFVWIPLKHNSSTSWTMSFQHYCPEHFFCVTFPFCWEFLETFRRDFCVHSFDTFPTIWVSRYFHTWPPVLHSSSRPQHGDNIRVKRRDSNSCSCPTSCPRIKSSEQRPGTSTLPERILWPHPLMSPDWITAIFNSFSCLLFLFQASLCNTNLLKVNSVGCPNRVEVITWI